MIKLGLLGCLVSMHAFGAVQSHFQGPVDLKVWKHWQTSWNVESDTKEPSFELIRFTDGKVTLMYRTNETGLRARLRCDSWVRQSEWAMKELKGEVQEARENANHFTFQNASHCVDVSEKNITTKISIEILRGETRIFSYDLFPMYVRGKNQSYWNNRISSYSAHAGTGQISVATSIKSEEGWDKWAGILVNPVLNFVDRNTLSAGAEIGLHRHEKNQEMYFVESGSLEMRAGVSTVQGEEHSIVRKWDDSGKMEKVSEFKASGGWIETRLLAPGELSVIVPNPNNPQTVYFHGAKALEPTVFWTMGTKN